MGNSKDRQEDTSQGALPLTGVADPSNQRAFPFYRLVAQISGLAEELSKPSIADGSPEPKGLRERIEAAAKSLLDAAEKLDPTKRPLAIFDPANPTLVGRFIALTLIAQDKVKLGAVDPFYGAGVYAIYYTGSFAQYRPISGAEHPIYVGKADPSVDGATTAVQQGTKLFDRLAEHRKNIAKARNLRIDDFECRFLVVATGWQKAAEDYLIKLFRPIWNSEVGLAFGLGKHGDSSKTRGNKRSPWDTMHPGRLWAEDIKEDQKSLAKIDEELKRHFEGTKPYRDIQDIFGRFMLEMHQLRSISSTNSA